MRAPAERSMTADVEGVDVHEVFHRQDTEGEAVAPMEEGSTEDPQGHLKDTGMSTETIGTDEDLHHREGEETMGSGDPRTEAQ